ncbi:uncharacterized protein LOC100569335 [Acyrthosiphon pisum]|uniref:Uncharacterized protein n=1 Tax=Acyrthosiphon pisum TaxID=7029 RepID=A0A8R1W6D5_ACYPI|nr:uncharacterized protein LOC100569335 [Acyrthosiphon pisum]|eukprot:XP_003245629.1 PREDICTED: uncharacterized protein LOC100569335 [Acyrthosiphon pisum]
MTFVAQNSKNIIIYLLVGCLFQMGNIHSIPVPANDASEMVDKTNSMTNDGEKTPINGVEPVGDVFKSLIKNTGSAVSNVSSETGQSLKEIAQAGGRATLALGYLVSQLFDGLSATVATSSGYLASGVRNIDDIVGDLPILGTVTGTLDAVMTHVSNTVGEMSANGRKSRQKMFDGLREHLNRSRLPSAENSSASSGSGKSDATAAAA